MADSERAETPASPAQAWRGPATISIGLIAAATLPVAFNPWGYNAFELPKTVLLRGFVLLAGPILLVRIIEGHASPPSRRTHPLVFPLLWPALLSSLTLILATIFSVNRHGLQPQAVSFWGSYERQQGLFTLAGYLILFLVTAASLRTHAHAE